MRGQQDGLTKSDAVRRAPGLGLLFASACDGTGVAVAMEAVAALALENKKRRQALGVTKPPSLSLDDLHAREKRGSSNCC